MPPFAAAAALPRQSFRRCCQRRGLSPPLMPRYACRQIDARHFRTRCQADFAAEMPRLLVERQMRRGALSVMPRSALMLLRCRASAARYAARYDMPRCCHMILRRRAMPAHARRRSPRRRCSPRRATMLIIASHAAAAFAALMPRRRRRIFRRQDAAAFARSDMPARRRRCHAFTPPEQRVAAIPRRFCAALRCQRSNATPIAPIASRRRQGQRRRYAAFAPRRRAQRCLMSRCAISLRCAIFCCFAPYASCRRHVAGALADTMITTPPRAAAPCRRSPVTDLFVDAFSAAMIATPRRADVAAATRTAR